MDPVNKPRPSALPSVQAVLQTLRAPTVGPWADKALAVLGPWARQHALTFAAWELYYGEQPNRVRESVMFK